MLHKKQRKMERYIEGLELQTDRLVEENTYLVNENTVLKEKMETNMKAVKGIEWDVEAICRYLEKDN